MSILVASGKITKIQMAIDDFEMLKVWRAFVLILICFALRLLTGCTSRAV